MRNTLYIMGLLLAAFACGPKNEEVEDEQVTVGPPTEALDTVANTRKDAVLTDENDTNPTMPMPQPVMQLLTQQYQGWKQPTLTREAQKLAANYVQGPTIVRGDFNGDNQQDLALQLQHNNDLVIVAAMQEQEGAYKLYEIKRDIMFNERSELKSLYYLYLLEKGETLQNNITKEEIESANDAVVVGLEEGATAFLYEGGSFTPYGVSK